ncbi:hypothetical protein Bbelb_248530 [Branchiostoma belcheri]|nr:hypothetical protein Bbelb_248530 [Branchiostoma belcheri]
MAAISATCAIIPFPACNGARFSIRTRVWRGQREGQLSRVTLRSIDPQTGEKRGHNAESCGAVGIMLTPKRSRVRIFSLHSCENEYLASVGDVPRIGHNWRSRVWGQPLPTHVKKTTTLV